MGQWLRRSLAFTAVVRYLIGVGVPRGEFEVLVSAPVPGRPRSAFARRSRNPNGARASGPLSVSNWDNVGPNPEAVHHHLKELGRAKEALTRLQFGNY